MTIHIEDMEYGGFYFEWYEEKLVKFRYIKNSL